MDDRLRNSWEVLRSSLWFIPTLVTALAVALALVLLSIDQTWGRRWTPPWYLISNAEGARSALSTVATSIITVAGVAFSITMVALALAASQFGSQLLSSYLRNRVSQAVLGTFTGTFVYCLIVLGAVGGGGERYVPILAVNTTVLLALASLAAFIIFIHQLTQELKAEKLAARVGGELIAAVETIFPAHPAAPPAGVIPRFGAGAWPLTAQVTGYLQAIEWRGLVRLAERHDITLRLTVRAGDFISRGSPVGCAMGAAAEQREALGRALVGHLIVGHRRTPTQDPEYSVHQLSQVAVRALSPAINDPYTALICVDWLEAALLAMARRGEPASVHADRRGRIRAVAPDAGFAVMIDAAFNKLRHAARGNAALLARLIKAATHMAQVGRDPRICGALALQLALLREEVRSGALIPTEREDAEKLCDHAQRVLSGAG